jgi:putative transposase
MALPQGPNQRWSLDFLSDAMTDGRRFRILAVVDDFTRECLTLVADTSLPGLRVARELDTLIAVRGRPAMVVSDNGAELTSMALVAGPASCVALHCTGQADPECVHRELQWPHVERDAVQLARPCPRGFVALERRLQHDPTAQRSRQSHTSGLCGPQRSRYATGRDAALCRGLRAPSRCSTEPTGLKSTRDSAHRWMKEGIRSSGRAIGKSSTG